MICTDDSRFDPAVGSSAALQYIKFDPWLKQHLIDLNKYSFLEKVSINTNNTRAYCIKRVYFSLKIVKI